MTVLNLTVLYRNLLFASFFGPIKIPIAMAIRILGPKTRGLRRLIAMENVGSTGAPDTD